MQRVSLELLSIFSIRPAPGCLPLYTHHNHHLQCHNLDHHFLLLGRYCYKSFLFCLMGDTKPSLNCSNKLRAPVENMISKVVAKQLLSTNVNRKTFQLSNSVKNCHPIFDQPTNVCKVSDKLVARLDLRRNKLDLSFAPPHQWQYNWTRAPSCLLIDTHSLGEKWIFFINSGS